MERGVSVDGVADHLALSDWEKFIGYNAVWDKLRICILGWILTVDTRLPHTIFSLFEKSVNLLGAALLTSFSMIRTICFAAYGSDGYSKARFTDDLKSYCKPFLIFPSTMSVIYKLMSRALLVIQHGGRWSRLNQKILTVLYLDVRYKQGLELGEISEEPKSRC